MKKLLSVLFYLIAFGAASYFLREYLNVPKVFLISLIASLGVLLLLIANKSRFTRPLGIILLLVHIIWFAGIFIPVYEETPDIRQWYRRNPSIIRSLSSASSGLIVTLEAQKQTQTIAAPALFSPKPLYQGNRIRTAGPSLQSSERILIGFWDGSNVQLLPQTSVALDTLAPDFAMLTGSRIGLTLEGGIISLATRRENILPEQWYLQAGDIFFSCKECVVALSGARGSIASNDTFTWRTANGEPIPLSGGTYSFTRNNVTAISSASLMTLFSDMHSATVNRNVEYDTLKRAFIIDQWGWAMDSSFLLGTLSKVKMALVGLFDWTYRTKYNNLMLYEYMRGRSDTLPPPFASQEFLYTFTE